MTAPLQRTVPLRGGGGPSSITPLIDHLASDHRVVAPTHPRWDGTVRA
ncbi:hypothetical protein [Streptomyces sp. NPDC005476]